MKIIIEVSGGLVSGVYVDSYYCNGKPEAHILDHDNIQAAECDLEGSEPGSEEYQLRESEIKEGKELQEAIKNMHCIW